VLCRSEQISDSDSDAGRTAAMLCQPTISPIAHAQRKHEPNHIEEWIDKPVKGAPCLVLPCFLSGVLQRLPACECLPSLSLSLLHSSSALLTLLCSAQQKGASSHTAATYMNQPSPPTLLILCQVCCTLTWCDVMVCDVLGMGRV